jgi:hypothetical protein
MGIGSTIREETLGKMGQKRHAVGWNGVVGHVTRLSTSCVRRIDKHVRCVGLVSCHHQ